MKPTRTDMWGSDSAKPLIVILIGPPGAGKGTHAAPLSQELGLPHISTGDLFRENMRQQTALGILAQQFINQGKLVPDALVLDMLFQRIAQDDCRRGSILDGFPRTLPQAEALEAALGATNQIAALYFALADPVIVERLSGRLICKGCSRPSHLIFDSPQIQGRCNSCQQELYQREDDKKEVVLKRLEVYHAQTQPVIHFYAQQEGVLRTIDCSQSKERVFQEIVESLPFSNARLYPFHLNGTLENRIESH